MSTNPLDKTVCKIKEQRKLAAASGQPPVPLQPLRTSLPQSSPNSPAPRTTSKHPSLPVPAQAPAIAIENLLAGEARSLDCQKMAENFIPISAIGLGRIKSSSVVKPLKIQPPKLIQDHTRVIYPWAQLCAFFIGGDL